MSAAARERVTALVAVAVVALIAAIVSYAHMQQLAAGTGESWRSYLLPLSVDGLVVAASMVLVGRRRAGEPGGTLAWSALAGGVLASVAANMADAGAGAVAILTAGWPAIAFAVAFELLQQQRQIRHLEPPPVTELSAPPEPIPAQPLSPVPAAASPAPARPLPATPDIDRVRRLVHDGHGRQAIASELGVSAHKARQLIAAARQPEAVPA